MITRASSSPPYLYRKSRFLNEEMPHYPEQLAFDDALDNLNLLDAEGYGPKPHEFDARLEAARWTIDGFNLMRSQTQNDLDTEGYGSFYLQSKILFNRDLPMSSTEQSRINHRSRPETKSMIECLVADNHTLLLSQQGFEAFIKQMDNPPPPTLALRLLMARLPSDAH